MSKSKREVKRAMRNSEKENTFEQFFVFGGYNAQTMPSTSFGRRERRNFGLISFAVLFDVRLRTRGRLLSCSSRFYHRRRGT